MIIIVRNNNYIHS